MWKLTLMAAAGLIACVMTSGTLEASTHSYTNKMRTSIGTNYYISQSLTGSYGTVLKSGTDVESGEGFEEKSKWKGTGFKTAFGLETMKFFSLELGHSFINKQDAYNRLNNLSGSQLNLEAKLSFASPAGNLGLASGITGARYDYQNSLESASFYGSGIYYAIDVSYYITSKVSAFGIGKISNENLVKNNGSGGERNLKTDMTHFGVGFLFWI